MIDTLKLKSPFITEEVAKAIEALLVQRHGVDMPTGEELYCLCSGSLEGSWSSSVSVNVLRNEFLETWCLEGKGGPGSPVGEYPPYLVVEGSVHKAMIGHNVTGGPCSLRPSIAWFVADVEKRLGVALPSWDSWRIMRIDVSEVYDLGSYEAVAQYLHGLGLARFPRRKAIRYTDECVMFPSNVSTLKFYHKGPEFAKNGYKVVVKALSQNMAEKIQRVANNLLRVECSIKSRKLNELYGRTGTAGQAALDALEAILDRNVGTVLKEAEHDMETVRTTEEVEARLREVYEARLAMVLFGTWLRLAASGESHVRNNMAKVTYYRHRKQLAEAGIAWDATDVYIREQSFIPAGFRPVRSDPRRLAGECLEVKELLMPYALA